MPYEGEYWVDDYYCNDRDYEAEIKADNEIELKRLKTQMDAAYDKYLLTSQRGLRDASLRKIDYNDAVERFEAQKKFMQSFKPETK